MKFLNVVLQFTLTILLASCGNNNELGMKITITEVAVPSPIPTLVAEAKAGKLKIAFAGSSIAQSQPQADALAVAFSTKKPPVGDLIFTKLSIRNRSMEHPSRASGEIDATCI